MKRRTTESLPGPASQDRASSLRKILGKKEPTNAGFLQRKGCEATSPGDDLLVFVGFHSYGDPSTSRSHQTGFTVAPQGEMIMNSKQVVLITGCSTGFGRMFAETLARKGHTVFATMRAPGGRNAKKASEIRALAEKDSLPIHVFEMDVTNDASVERAVNSAVAKTGRIDVAINNAGYYLSGLEEAVTTEQAQRLMDTNFFGPVRVNRAVLPYMRRQRSGVLMHISSAAGRVVLPSGGFYCASKFALEALAEAYSYELASQGIESVIVEPGQYETPVFGNTVTAADEARTNTYGAVKEIPAKINTALYSTAGNAQDVADAVLRIIETPAGEKQLRYLVSPQSFGVDKMNALSKQVQANLLEAFGLVADTKFVKGKAVGSV
jgi:NAD(P)-dependent dehydrogenase (short-subunit alcohol dehydrogenase family)